MSSAPDFEISEGTGYADLGLDDPEELLVKAKLVHAIASGIERRGWDEGAAASRLGLAPTDLSGLLRGHFDDFSTDRLRALLNRLGSEVTIAVAPKGDEAPAAGVSVVFDPAAPLVVNSLA